MYFLYMLCQHFKTNTKHWWDDYTECIKTSDVWKIYFPKKIHFLKAAES